MNNEKKKDNESKNDDKAKVILCGHGGAINHKKLIESLMNKTREECIIKKKNIEK